jgi:hypothetical protein
MDDDRSGHVADLLQRWIHGDRAALTQFAAGVNRQMRVKNAR